MIVKNGRETVFLVKIRYAKIVFKDTFQYLNTFLLKNLYKQRIRLQREQVVKP